MFSSARGWMSLVPKSLQVTTVVPLLKRPRIWRRQNPLRLCYPLHALSTSITGISIDTLFKSILAQPRSVESSKTRSSVSREPYHNKFLRLQWFETSIPGHQFGILVRNVYTPPGRV
jgi:hypothetical protein